MLSARHSVMDFDTLWGVADRARARSRLAPKDISFVRDVVPDELDAFPKLKLPATVRHPAGFSISGASVGTFLRSALLVAGQKALGRRCGGHEFYERVEKDLAFGIMRSHFHHGYPKGAHCCVQCTLAVIPVLDAGAIRYFDCRELASAARRLVRQRQWRFAKSADPRMVRWALGDGQGM
jgi:hypothetical protein